MDEPVVRESLRDIVANDSYAATFQSIKQYRAAILQHIANRAAADGVLQLQCKGDPHHE